MKRAPFCTLLLSLGMLVCTPTNVFAQSQRLQQGTIVRMRMTDCVASQHRFMVEMSGAGKTDNGVLCPEYVLLAERVVYVISGKNSEQLIPLAEVTRFRLQKNELLIRIEDAAKESRFRIKSMVLRPEWDRSQQLEEAEASAMITRHSDTVMTRGQP